MPGFYTLAARGNRARVLQPAAAMSQSLCRKGLPVVVFAGTARYGNEDKALQQTNVYDCNAMRNDYSCQENATR
jgi:hypothetical protein